MKFGTLMQNTNVLNMLSSSIFEKRIFPAENAGNMPENPVFLHFLEIFH